MTKLRINVPPSKVQEFCRKWRLKELSLFGSILREDFGPNSDVDVLVELAPDSDLSLLDWVEMIEELESIFGRRVDLVSKGGLRNPFRRDSILAKREVMYAG